MKENQGSPVASAHTGLLTQDCHVVTDFGFYPEGGEKPRTGFEWESGKITLPLLKTESGAGWQMA